MSKYKTKEYPLSIMVLGDWEYSGKILVYYSKGHQDKAEFVKLIAQEYDEVIDPDEVVHYWAYSCLMDTEDGLYEKGTRTTRFLMKQPKRMNFKFPCTMVDMELITYDKDAQ